MTDHREYQPCPLHKGTAGTERYDPASRECALAFALHDQALLCHGMAHLNKAAFGASLSVLEGLIHNWRQAQAAHAAYLRAERETDPLDERAAVTVDGVRLDTLDRVTTYLIAIESEFDRVMQTPDGLPHTRNNRVLEAATKLMAYAQKIWPKGGGTFRADIQRLLLWLAAGRMQTRPVSFRTWLAEQHPLYTLADWQGNFVDKFLSDDPEVVRDLMLWMTRRMGTTDMFATTLRLCEEYLAFIAAGTESVEKEAV